MWRGVVVEVLPPLLHGVLHLYKVVGHFHLGREETKEEEGGGK